jgi:hypothetical protein
MQPCRPLSESVSQTTVRINPFWGCEYPFIIDSVPRWA